MADIARAGSIQFSGCDLERSFDRHTDARAIRVFDLVPAARRKWPREDPTERNHSTPAGVVSQLSWYQRERATGFGIGRRGLAMPDEIVSDQRQRPHQQ